MTATLKFEDEDDYGMPRRRAPSTTTTRQFVLHRLRRSRNPIIVAATIFLLVYWLRSGRARSPAATDWSRYAYVLYATDAHTMCNAFMVFEALSRLGSKADRVLLYPQSWNAATDDPHDRNSQLLVRARKQYRVNAKPIQLLALDGPAPPGTLQSPSTWHTAITKLRAFELIEYDRVLYLDSDVTLQKHMDELFAAPPAPVAMPRSYWYDWEPRDWPLSSAVMLIEPNPAEIKHLYDMLQQWRLNPARHIGKHYERDLLNERFGASAMVLPHRPYVLQTSEFRSRDHRYYLGTTNAPFTAGKWDPFKAVAEAKLVHFDDHPLPKPWIMWPTEGLLEIQPKCGGGHTGTCGDREVWKGLYDDFRHRRKDVCRILSVPAPESWAEWKNMTEAD